MYKDFFLSNYSETQKILKDSFSIVFIKDKIYSMIELTSKQRKVLEKFAQPLSALIQIGGAGLTEEQVKHINTLIASHELIKIKYNILKSLAGSESKEEISQSRHELDSEIEAKTNSTHVRTIGNVAIFYRPAKEAKDRKYEKALSKA